MSDSLLFEKGCNSCMHWREDPFDPDIGRCVNTDRCDAATKAGLRGNAGDIDVAAWWQFPCHEMSEKDEKDSDASKGD